MSLVLPHAFGRYALTQRIGEGGMAEVYQAQVTVAEGLTKRVVVKKIRKELADQPEFTRMFVDEAKIALGLNHANIVQVFDFGQVHGSFYLAMELVEGVDLMGLLHTIRARGERVPVVIAAYIAHQVAAGLAYAHQKRDDFGTPLGIVHRDISPHNIMLSHAGTVKILDFGIARTAARARQGRPRPDDEAGDVTIQGKIAYMSPEQAVGGPLDQRSDIYSLGVVLYELLSGELVFRHRDRFVALEQMRTRPLPPLRDASPEVPEALAAVVERALARDPAERWDSARALQSALAGFLHRADPVVDDEVLSAFVVRYFSPARGPAPAVALEDETRELEGSDPSQAVQAPRPELQRVVLLKAALEPAVPGERPPPPAQFLALARDIAYKRDAQVCQLEAGGILLAFGTVLDTGDTDETAVRAALALREAIGEAAPGYGIGMVLAGLALPVVRGGAGPHRAEVPHEVARRLQTIAARVLDGAVMIAGDLGERLQRSWRVGPPRGFELERAGLRDMSRETGNSIPLEHAAPLLGPVREPEERLPAVPGGRVVLIGRELEQKALRDAFAEAIRARSSRAVLLIGGPGVGKRALVDRFVASLPRGACVVLRGSGQWRRRNVPLGVFLAMFRDYFEVDRNSTAADLEARLLAGRIAGADQIAGTLAAALGLAGTGEARGELDPLERRDRLWRLVRRLIRALGQRRPVLIVLENLHFLDEQSVSLLQEWMHRQHGLPLLGVCTARAGPRADLLRALPGVHTIELRELDEQARRELILRRFEDSEDAEPIADAILARTGGNPLFIEETLADLLRRGILGWSTSSRSLQVRQRGATIDLHPTIEAALHARVDALDPEDRALVDAAAVLGLSFRTAELATLRQRPTAARAVDRLLELGLFAPEPGARFASACFSTVSLHEVVKLHLAPATAEALHREAAAIKLQRPDHRPGRDDGPIADHLAQAGAPAAAIDPAMRAARAARDVAGNVEAYYYWSLALRAMSRDDARRWEALLEREAILRVWGRRRAQGADIRQILGLAEAAGDPEREVIALGRLLRFYLECGRIQRADQLYPRLAQQTLALPAGEVMDAHRAELGELGCDLMTRLGRLEEAEALARAALAHCPPGHRGLQQRCRLHTCIGRVQLASGSLVEAAASFEATLQLARGAGYKRLEAEALNSLGEVAGLSTRYQEAVEFFRAALQIDRELGDRAATGVKLANLGIAYTAIGLYRRAERHLRKALELHEAIGHPGLLGAVIVHLGEVSAELGDAAAARPLLDEAAAMAAARGDVRTELRARARLARALLDAGASEEARALAEVVLARGREHGLRSAQTRALHVLSRIAEEAGDLDRAIDLETEAVRLVRAGAAPLDGVLAIHHLGHLSGRADLLQEAADRVRARLEHLRDPELRRGYLAQTKVQEILADAGPPIDPADPPA